MNGVELIKQERERQISEEGYTLEHDNRHDKGEIALAAACYAAPKPIYVHEERTVQVNSSRGMEGPYQYNYGYRTDYYDAWPWDGEWDKRDKHDRLRQLVIAGALIAAR